MTVRGKTILWAFVLGIVFAAILIINAQLNKTIESVEVKEAAPQQINPDVETHPMLVQKQPSGSAAIKMAISIIPAPLAEDISKPKQQEESGEKVAYQSQESTANAANRGSAVSGISPKVTIKKDPSVTEKKELSSKGVVIF